MAKAQYPLDGRLGKDWKITSEMGWRIHPVKKEKKHHNGADIIGLGKGPFYIEAPYAGKVLKATKSTAPGGGFGNFVILAHKINGKNYTTLYAHLKDGSIKVKPGQKIEAGTVLGIMGTTGMSTGVHLHWEMWAGKTHGWSADGKGFVNAVKFFKALIAQEAELALAPKATPEDAPATEEPEHTEEFANKVQAKYEAAKAEAKVAPTTPTPAPAPVAVAPAKPAVAVPATKPALKGELKKGSKGATVAYLQKALGLEVTGVFDQALHVAVIGLQKKHADITLDDGIVGPLTWSKIK
jgi:murein DD-endopeptidase MepM/ murein hydrolase activator NlpD